MNSMQVELHSPLSLDDCKHKLQENLITSDEWLKHTGKLFYGRVKEQEFSLRLAKGSRNPFVPYFHGILEPTTAGTILRGGFGLLTGLKWAAIVWVLLWVIMPCGVTVLAEAVWIGFFVAVGESFLALGSEPYLTMLMIPLLILPLPVMGAAVGIGFPALFIALRTGDREQIIALLQNLLDADVYRSE